VRAAMLRFVVTGDDGGGGLRWPDLMVVAPYGRRS
jgi:hypothetical protein